MRHREGHATKKVQPQGLVSTANCRIQEMTAQDLLPHRAVRP